MKSGIGKRGAFIVLEGCDRAGKTTQCKKIAENLKALHISFEPFSFPNRSTRVGKVINEYLTNKTEISDQAVHLLFAANRWELQSEFEKLLLAGTTLIVDRYSYSGVAFSAAKKGMNLEWCWQIESGLLKPDLVLLLQTSDAVASVRADYGVERYEQPDFQKAVSKNFETLFNGTINHGSTVCEKIDGEKDIESINEEIMTYVINAIKAAENQPLSRIGPSVGDSSVDMPRLHNGYH